MSENTHKILVWGGIGALVVGVGALGYYAVSHRPAPPDPLASEAASSAQEIGLQVAEGQGSTASPSTPGTGLTYTPTDYASLIASLQAPAAAAAPGPPLATVAGATTPGTGTTLYHSAGTFFNANGQEVTASGSVIPNGLTLHADGTVGF